jgi:hypothetical protein
MEHELETLRAKATGSSDEQVTEMTALLQTAQQRKEKLEVENRCVMLESNCMLDRWVCDCRQQALRIVELENDVKTAYAKRLDVWMFGPETTLVLQWQYIHGSNHDRGVGCDGTRLEEGPVANRTIS